MRLKTRVLIIVLSSLIGLMVMGLFGLYAMRQSMMEERRTQITQLLDFADGQLRHYHELETSGKLSRKEAQARAIEAIGAQREGDNYFFIRSLKDDTFVWHQATGWTHGRSDVSGCAGQERNEQGVHRVEYAQAQCLGQNAIPQTQRCTQIRALGLDARSGLFH